MDEEITFGQWLRQRRRALDLTQNDLAQLAGYSMSAIRKVEAEERKPSRDMAERLAEKLQVLPTERSRVIQLARGTLGTAVWTPPEREDSGQRLVSEQAAQPTPGSRHGPVPRLTNLPVALTSFVGREAERREIKSFLATKRLVTLTGAGGSGKTRLAAQVASEILADYPDGVWFVDLAPLNDPSWVPHAVALAVDLSEKSDEPLLTTLINGLQARHLLLIVDNCEHLLDACASLVEMSLRRCSQLTILATSREPLRIAGEHILRVPSLDVPPAESALMPTDLLAFDAVRLFVDRAEAAKVGFSLSTANSAAVVETCRRLDGIPLAIELAAARTSGLTVEQIAHRLDQQFQLLTSGNRTALPRQQTLRATLDWSYALLTEAERLLFRRLAVFVGSFSLEAVEAICRGDGLDQADIVASLLALVDKSLVVAREQGDEARYHLLEPTRQYARDHLGSSGEVDAVFDRHCAWYVALVGSIGNGLWDVNQATWRERLDQEHGNLRVVLAWCKDHDATIGLRIATTLSRFWMDRAYLSEGRDWLEAMLSRAPERTIARARALQVLGFRNAFLGAGASRAALEESAAICEELGDKAALGVALGNLGRLAGEEGDYRKERELDERALVLLREAGDLHVAGDQSHVGIILADLGELADWEGHHEEARRLYVEAVAVFRRVAGNRRGVGYTHTLLGDLQRRMGDRAQARESIEFGLKLAREIGHAGNTSMALVRLARLSRDEGDLDQARATLDECLAFLMEEGLAVASGEVLSELGKLALVEGDVAQAKSRLAESLSLFRQGGTRLETVNALSALGGVAVREREYKRGVQLIAAAATLDAFFWTSLDPAERFGHQASLAIAKSALGAEAFATTWAEGQAMTLEQAIGYALGRALST